MTEAARRVPPDQLHLRSPGQQVALPSFRQHTVLPQKIEAMQQSLDEMHARHEDLELRIAQLETALRVQVRPPLGDTCAPLTAGDERLLPSPGVPDAGEARPAVGSGPASGIERQFALAAPDTRQSMEAIERVSPQHELKNRFIYNLLNGHLNDESIILRDAKILGMDFTPPRTVILIDAADYILWPADAYPGEAADVQIRRRAQAIIRSVVDFFYLPNETICAYLGDGEVAVLKASDTRNLVNWVEPQEIPDRSGSGWANLPALRRAGNALLRQLRSTTGTSVSIGIGRYHPGISELARSYQDARAALSLGRRFCGENGVYSLDNLGIAAFVGVSDEQTKIDLATHLLSPLSSEPELLDTLDAFFAENCCPSTTATRLSIHRNTLSYRLDKITALTGLNPRHFDDGVQIRLALALRSLCCRGA